MRAFKTSDRYHIMSYGTSLSFMGREPRASYVDRIYPDIEELGTPLPLLRRYYDDHPDALLKYMGIQGVVKIHFPFERRKDSWFLYAIEGVVVNQHHNRAGWCAIEPVPLMIMLSDIAPRPVFGSNMHLEIVARKRSAEELRWRVFVR
jgi:hypothetical protein